MLRNRRFKFLIHSIAWSIVTCFVWQDFVFAQGGVAASPAWVTGETLSASDRYDIPADLGHLRKRSEAAADSRWVIHIQDAHQSFSAQKAIAKLVGNLAARYELDLVGIEGSSGLVDTTLVSSFPIQPVRQQAAEALLRNTRISGAEFEQIVSQEKIEIFGLEDPSLYQDNIGRFQDLLRNSGELYAALGSLKKLIRRLEQKIYSEETARFFETVRGYESGDADFKKYWDLIGPRVEKSRLSAAVQLSKLVEANQLETQVDFQKATEERERLIDILKTRLPKETLEALVNEAAEYKLGRLSGALFHLKLCGAAKSASVPPAAFANLLLYTRYAQQVESIDLLALHQETRQIEEGLTAAALKTADEKAVGELSRSAEILAKLLEGKLSRADEEYLAAHPAALDLARIRSDADRLRKKIIPSEFYGINFDLLERKIPEADLFYRAVRERNEMMVRNLTRRMSEKNVRVAALVSGGFHSEDLSDLLSRNRVSHLVVLPKFDGSGPERPYLTIITQKGSFLDQKVRDEARMEAAALVLASAVKSGLRPDEARRLYADTYRKAQFGPDDEDQGGSSSESAPVRNAESAWRFVVRFDAKGSGAEVEEAELVTADEYLKSFALTELKQAEKKHLESLELIRSIKDSLEQPQGGLKSAISGARDRFALSWKSKRIRTTGDWRQAWREASRSELRKKGIPNLELLSADRRDEIEKLLFEAEKDLETALGPKSDAGRSAVATASIFAGAKLAPEAIVPMILGAAVRREGSDRVEVLLPVPGAVPAAQGTRLSPAERELQTDRIRAPLARLLGRMTAEHQVIQLDQKTTDLVRSYLQRVVGSELTLSDRSLQRVAEETLEDTRDIRSRKIGGRWTYYNQRSDFADELERHPEERETEEGLVASLNLPTSREVRARAETTQKVLESLNQALARDLPADRVKAGRRLRDFLLELIADGQIINVDRAEEAVNRRFPSHGYKSRETLRAALRRLLAAIREDAAGEADRDAARYSVQGKPLAWVNAPTGRGNDFFLYDPLVRRNEAIADIQDNRIRTGLLDLQKGAKPLPDIGSAADALFEDALTSSVLEREEAWSDRLQAIADSVADLAGSGMIQDASWDFRAAVEAEFDRQASTVPPSAVRDYLNSASFQGVADRIRDWKRRQAEQAEQKNLEAEQKRVEEAARLKKSQNLQEARSAVRDTLNEFAFDWNRQEFRSDATGASVTEAVERSLDGYGLDPADRQALLEEFEDDIRIATDRFVLESVGYDLNSFEQRAGISWILTADHEQWVIRFGPAAAVYPVTIAAKTSGPEGRPTVTRYTEVRVPTRGESQAADEDEYAARASLTRDDGTMALATARVKLTRESGKTDVLLSLDAPEGAAGNGETGLTDGKKRKNLTIRAIKSGAQMGQFNASVVEAKMAVIRAEDKRVGELASEGQDRLSRFQYRLGDWRPASEIVGQIWADFLDSEPQKIRDRVTRAVRQDIDAAVSRLDGEMQGYDPTSLESRMGIRWVMSADRSEWIMDFDPDAPARPATQEIVAGKPGSVTTYTRIRIPSFGKPAADNPDSYTADATLVSESGQTVPVRVKVSVNRSSPTREIRIELESRPDSGIAAGWIKASKKLGWLGLPNTRLAGFIGSAYRPSALPADERRQEIAGRLQAATTTARQGVERILKLRHQVRERAGLPDRSPHAPGPTSTADKARYEQMLQAARVRLDEIRQDAIPRLIRMVEEAKRLKRASLTGSRLAAKAMFPDGRPIEADQEMDLLTRRLMEAEQKFNDGQAAIALADIESVLFHISEIRKAVEKIGGPNAVLEGFASFLDEIESVAREIHGLADPIAVIERDIKYEEVMEDALSPAASGAAGPAVVPPAPVVAPVPASSSPAGPAPEPIVLSAEKAREREAAQELAWSQLRSVRNALDRLEMLVNRTGDYAVAPGSAPEISDEVIDYLLLNGILKTRPDGSLVFHRLEDLFEKAREALRIERGTKVTEGMLLNFRNALLDLITGIRDILGHLSEFKPESESADDGSDVLREDEGPSTARRPDDGAKDLLEILEKEVFALAEPIESRLILRDAGGPVSASDIFAPPTPTEAPEERAERESRDKTRLFLIHSIAVSIAGVALLALFMGFFGFFFGEKENKKVAVAPAPVVAPEEKKEAAAPPAPADIRAALPQLGENENDNIRGDSWSSPPDELAKARWQLARAWMERQAFRDLAAAGAFGDPAIGGFHQAEIPELPLNGNGVPIAQEWSDRDRDLMLVYTDGTRVKISDALFAANDVDLRANDNRFRVDRNGRFYPPKGKTFATLDLDLNNDISATGIRKKDGSSVFDVTGRPIGAAVGGVWNGHRPAAAAPVYWKRTVRRLADGALFLQIFDRHPGETKDGEFYTLADGTRAVTDKSSHVYEPPSAIWPHSGNIGISNTVIFGENASLAAERKAGERYDTALARQDLLRKLNNVPPDMAPILASLAADDYANFRELLKDTMVGYAAGPDYRIIRSYARHEDLPPIGNEPGNLRFYFHDRELELRGGNPLVQYDPKLYPRTRPSKVVIVNADGSDGAEVHFTALGNYELIKALENWQKLKTRVLGTVAIESDFTAEEVALAKESIPPVAVLMKNPAGNIVALPDMTFVIGMIEFYGKGAQDNYTLFYNGDITELTVAGFTFYRPKDQRYQVLFLQWLDQIRSNQVLAEDQINQLLNGPLAGANTGVKKQLKDQLEEAQRVLTYLTRDYARFIPVDGTHQFMLGHKISIEKEEGIPGVVNTRGGFLREGDLRALTQNDGGTLYIPVFSLAERTRVIGYVVRKVVGYKENARGEVTQKFPYRDLVNPAARNIQHALDEEGLVYHLNDGTTAEGLYQLHLRTVANPRIGILRVEDPRDGTMIRTGSYKDFIDFMITKAAVKGRLLEIQKRVAGGGFVWISSFQAPHFDPALARRFGRTLPSANLPSASIISIDAPASRVIGKRESGPVFDQTVMRDAELLFERHLQNLENMRLEALRLGQPDRARQFHQEMVTAIRSRSFSPPVGSTWGASRVTLDGYAMTGRTLSEQLNDYLDDLWFTIEGAIERERMNETGGVIKYGLGGLDMRLSILSETAAWMYPETLVSGRGGVLAADSHFGGASEATNRTLAVHVAAEIRRRTLVEWNERDRRAQVIDNRERRVTEPERRRAEDADSLEELLRLRNQARSKREHIKYEHQDTTVVPKESRVVQTANRRYEEYIRDLDFEVRRLRAEVEGIEAPLRGIASTARLNSELQKKHRLSDGLDRTYADRKVELLMKEAELERNREAYMFIDRSGDHGAGDREPWDNEYLVAVIASPDATRALRDGAVRDFLSDVDRLDETVEAMLGAQQGRGGYTLSIPGSKTDDHVLVGEEKLVEAKGLFAEVRKRILDGAGKRPENDYLAILMGYNHAEAARRPAIAGWARGMNLARRAALVDGWVDPDPSRDGKGYFLIRGTVRADGSFVPDWDGTRPDSKTYILSFVYGLQPAKELHQYHQKVHELVTRASRAIGTGQGLLRVNRFPAVGDTRDPDKVPDVVVDPAAVRERRVELLRQQGRIRVAYERAADADKPDLAAKHRVLEDGVEALDELAYIHQYGLNEALTHWNDLRREADGWNPNEVTLEGRDDNGMLTGDAVVFKRDPRTGRAVGDRIRTYQKQRLLSDPESGELIAVVRVVDHLRGIESYDWIRVDVPVEVGGFDVPKDLTAKSKIEVRAPGSPRDGPIAGYQTTHYEYLSGTDIVSKSETYFSQSPKDDYGRAIESAELLTRDGQPRRMTVDPDTGAWADDPAGLLLYRVTGASEGLNGETKNNVRLELRNEFGQVVGVAHELYQKEGAGWRQVQSSVSLRRLNPWGEIQSEVNWVSEFSPRAGEAPIQSVTRTEFKEAEGRQVPEATYEPDPDRRGEWRVRYRYSVGTDAATSLQTVTVTRGDGRFFAKRLETGDGRPLRILQDGILSVVEYAPGPNGFIETGRKHYLRGNPANLALDPKVDPARPALPADPTRFDGAILEDRTIERLADRTVWIERSDARFGSVQRIRQSADGNPIEVQWLQYENGPGSELVGVWTTRVLEMANRVDGIWRRSTLSYQPRGGAEVLVATYELQGEDAIDKFIPAGLVPGRDLRKEFKEKYNDGSDRVLVVKVTKHGPKATYLAMFPKRNRFGMIPVVQQQGHTITASGFVPASSIPSESFVFHQNTLERRYTTDFDATTGRLVTDADGNTRATAAYPDGTRFHVFFQPLNPEGTQAYEVSHDGYRFDIEWDNPQGIPNVPFGVRPSTKITDPEGNFLGRYSYSRSVTIHQGTPDEETVHEYSVDWAKTAEERSIDTSLMTAVFRNNGDKLYEVYGEKKTAGGMSPTKVLYYVGNKPFLVRDFASGKAEAMFVTEVIKDSSGRVRPGEYRVWEFPLLRDGDGNLYIDPKPVDGYSYKEYRNERLVKTRHNRFISTDEGEQAAMVKQFSEAFRSSLMMNLLREVGALEGKVPQTAVPDLSAVEKTMRENPVPVLPTEPSGSRLAGFGILAGLQDLGSRFMDWLVLDDLVRSGFRYVGLDSVSTVLVVAGLSMLSLHLLRFWDVKNWIPDTYRFVKRVFSRSPLTPTREVLRPTDTGTAATRATAIARQIAQMNYVAGRLDAITTLADLDALATTAYPGQRGFMALGFKETEARTLNDLLNPNVTWVPKITYDEFKAVVAAVRAEFGVSVFSYDQMRAEIIRRSVRTAFEPVVYGYMDDYGYYSESVLERNLNEAETAFSAAGGPDKGAIARIFPHSGLQLLTSIVPSQIPAPQVVEMIRKLRSHLNAHHRITSADYTRILESSDAGGGKILRDHPFRYDFLNAFIEIAGGDPVVRSQAVMRRDYLMEEVIERFMGYRLRRPELRIGDAADGYYIPYSQAAVDLIDIPLESFVLSRMVYHTMRTRRPGLLLEAQARLKAMAPADRRTKFTAELLRQDDLWAHVYSVIAYYIVENGTKQRNLLVRVLTQPSDVDRILYLADRAFESLNLPEHMSASFAALIDYADRAWHGMLPPTASRLALSMTPAEAQRELGKFNTAAKNVRAPGANIVQELDKLIAPPSGGALPAGALDPALADNGPVISQIRSMRDSLVLERELPVGAAAEAKKADGVARRIEGMSVPYQHRSLDGAIQDLRGLKTRFDAQIAAATTREEREQAALDAFAGLEQIDRGLGGRVNATAFDVGKGGPAAPRAALMGRGRMVLELISRAFLGAKKAEYEKLAIPQMTYKTTYGKFLKFILGNIMDRRYLGLPSDKPLRSLIAGWVSDPYFWDKQGVAMGLSQDEIAQSKRAFDAVGTLFRNTILYGAIMLFFILRFNLPRMIESKDYFYHAFPNNAWAGVPALAVAVTMSVIFFSSAWFFVLKNGLRERDRRVEDHVVRTTPDVLTTLEVLKGSPAGRRTSSLGIAGTGLVLFGVLALSGVIAGWAGAAVIAFSLTVLSQIVLFGGLAFAVHRALKDRLLINRFSLSLFMDSRPAALARYKLMIHSWDTGMTRFMDPATKMKFIRLDGITAQDIDALPAEAQRRLKYFLNYFYRHDVPPARREPGTGRPLPTPYPDWESMPQITVHSTVAGQFDFNWNQTRTQLYDFFRNEQLRAEWALEARLIPGLRPDTVSDLASIEFPSSREPFLWRDADDEVLPLLLAPRAVPNRKRFQLAMLTVDPSAAAALGIQGSPAPAPYLNYSSDPYYRSLRLAYQEMVVAGDAATYGTAPARGRATSLASGHLDALEPRFGTLRAGETAGTLTPAEQKELSDMRARLESSYNSGTDYLEAYIRTTVDLIAAGHPEDFGNPDLRPALVANAKKHLAIQNPRFADLSGRPITSMTDEELHELRLFDARMEGAYDEAHDTRAALAEIQDAIHGAKSQLAIERILRKKEAPATISAKAEAVKKALTDFTTAHTDTMIRIMTNYDQNLLMVYQLAEEYRPDTRFRAIKALVDPMGDKTIRQIRAEVAAQKALPASSRKGYDQTDGTMAALTDDEIAYFEGADRMYQGMVREKIRFMLQAVGNWVFTGPPDVAGQHQRLVKAVNGFELEVFLIEPSGKSLKPSKDGAMDFQQHLSRRVTWWPDVSNVLPDPAAGFLWHAAHLFDSDPKMALQLFNLRTSRDLNAVNIAAGTNESGFGTVQAAVDELFRGGLDVYGKFATQNDRMRGIIVPELKALREQIRSVLGARLAGAVRDPILVEGTNKLAILVRAAEDAAFAMGLKAEGHKTGFVGFVQVLQEKTNAMWMHDRQEWKYSSDVGELLVDEEAVRAKLSSGSPAYKAATDLNAQFFVRKRFVLRVVNKLFIGVVLLLGFNPWYGFPLPGLFVGLSYLYAQAISTPTLYQHQREQGWAKGTLSFVKKFLVYPNLPLFSASGLMGTYELAFTQDGLEGVPVFPPTERAGWQIPMQPKESGWISFFDRYKALYEKPGPHNGILFASWAFPAFAVFSQFHPKVQLFAMAFTSALVLGFLIVQEVYNPGALFFSKTYESAYAKYPKWFAAPLRLALKSASVAGFFVYALSRGVFETLVLSWVRVEKRSTVRTNLVGQKEGGIPITRNLKLVQGDRPLIIPVAVAATALTVWIPAFAPLAILFGLFMIFKSQQLYQEMNAARFYRDVKSFVEARKIRSAAGPGGLIYNAGFDAAGNKSPGIDHPWQALVEDLAAFTGRPASAYVKEVVWKDKSGAAHRRMIPNPFLFYALQKINSEPNQLEIDMITSADLLRQNPFLGVDTAYFRIITPLKAFGNQITETYTVPDADRRIRDLLGGTLTKAVGIGAVIAFLTVYFWTLPSISFTQAPASLAILLRADLTSHEWRNSLNFFASALPAGALIAGLGLVWVIRRVSRIAVWARGVRPPAPTPTLAGEIRSGTSAPGITANPPRSGTSSASGPAARLASADLASALDQVAGGAKILPQEWAANLGLDPREVYAAVVERDDFFYEPDSSGRPGFVRRDPGYIQTLRAKVEQAFAALQDDGVRAHELYYLPHLTEDLKSAIATRIRKGLTADDEAVIRHLLYGIGFGHADNGEGYLRLNERERSRIAEIRAPRAGTGVSDWTPAEKTYASFVNADAKIFAPVNPAADTGWFWLPARYAETKVNESELSDQERLIAQVVRQGLAKTGADWSVYHLGSSTLYDVTAAGPVDLDLFVSPLTRWADAAKVGQLRQEVRIGFADAKNFGGERRVSESVFDQTIFAPETISMGAIEESFRRGYPSVYRINREGVYRIFVNYSVRSEQAGRLAEAEPANAPRQDFVSAPAVSARILVANAASEPIAVEAFERAAAILGLAGQVKAEAVIVGSDRAREAFVPASDRSIPLLIDASGINALENPSQLRRQIALDLKGVWQDNLDRLEGELKAHLTSLEAQITSTGEERELALLQAQMTYLQQRLPGLVRLAGQDTHLSLALLASLKDQNRAAAFVIPVGLERFTPVIDVESFRQSSIDLKQTREALIHQIDILKEQVGVQVNPVLVVKTTQDQALIEGLNLPGNYQVRVSGNTDAKDLFQEIGIPEQDTDQAVLITSRTQKDQSLRFGNADNLNILVVDSETQKDPGLFILRAYDVAVTKGDVRNLIPGLSAITIQTKDGQKVVVVVMTPQPIDWAQVLQAAKISTQETARSA